ncbi:MAG: helix-turn-helix transcriptional regulator [Magnetococcales bacterium]|nr:helix-turn-helix transcriptional regulator [Magnetococcales bacterium]
MNVEFCERLRAERKRLGLNQTEFAKIAGLTLQSQGNYESGRRTPDVAYLAAVATAGVDVGYLLTGVRTPGGSVPAEGLDGYPEIGAEFVLSVLEATETYLVEEGLKVPPDKKARLVRVLCRLIAQKRREDARSDQVLQDIGLRDIRPHIDAIRLAG